MICLRENLPCVRYFAKHQGSAASTAWWKGVKTFTLGPQTLLLWIINMKGGFSSVQFSSVAQSCPTLCDPMNHSTPGLPVHHQLPEPLKLMSIESVMRSSHLILCRPLLLLPLIPPSIRVFSNESTLCMRWPKYWSFSFSIRTPL